MTLAMAVPQTALGGEDGKRTRQQLIYVCLVFQGVTLIQESTEC